MGLFLMALVCLVNLSLISASIQNPCRKLTRQNFFPHPHSTSKYIQCTKNGNMKIFECDEGEFWDPETLSCDKIIHADENEAFLASTTTTTTTTTTQEPEQKFRIRNLAMSLKNAFASDNTNNSAIESDLHLNTVNPVNQFDNSDQCSSLTFTDSSIGLVNGVYTKVKPNDLQPSKFSIYRRSDDLKLPGVLVALNNEQTWCITYSFSLVDVGALTLARIAQQCDNLKCCLLVSSIDANNNLELNDTSREWNLNLMGVKGKVDLNLKVACGNVNKHCPRIPFCPPECRGDRDGCEVCECNGKPFFEMHGTNQQSPETPIPTSNDALDLQNSDFQTFNQEIQTDDKTPEIFDQTNMQNNPINTTENNQFALVTTSTTTTTTTKPPMTTQKMLIQQEPQQPKTQFTQPFNFMAQHQQQNRPLIPTQKFNFINRQPAQFNRPQFQNFKNQQFFSPTSVPPKSSFSQLPLNFPQFRPVTAQSQFNRPQNIQRHFQQRPQQQQQVITNNQPGQGLFFNSKINHVKSIPINNCQQVKCPSNSICMKSPVCPNCNPACLANNSLLKINCQVILCPNGFKCALDKSDGHFKCVQ